MGKSLVGRQNWLKPHEALERVSSAAKPGPNYKEVLMERLKSGRIQSVTVERLRRNNDGMSLFHLTGSARRERKPRRYHPNIGGAIEDASRSEVTIASTDNLKYR